MPCGLLVGFYLWSPCFQVQTALGIYNVLVYRDCILLLLRRLWLGDRVIYYFKVVVRTLNECIVLFV